MNNKKLLITIILLIFITFGCRQMQSVNIETNNNLPATIQADKTFDPYYTESPLEMQVQEPFPPPLSSSKYSNYGSNRVKQTKKSKYQIKHQGVLDEALEYCEVSQDFWQKGDFENAIESLDRAYGLILEIDEDDLIQQRDDLRFLISKRLMEIYSSRNIVVNGSHKEIPLIMNKHVKAEIKKFTGVERKFFSESYKRSGRYRPYIVNALKKAGLPEALSWLPLIESGFKSRALSKSRALGLWQFIPSTGYKFGLKRNRYIDERMDFIKSTNAAIAYLTELHNMFGDWATVLAGYNCGESRVQRTIQKQNINYLDNFWDLFGQLPYETARYVPRFLATLHIVGNMKKYGFNPKNLDPPLQFETLEISKQVRLKDIAQKIGTTYDSLQLLNAELRYKSTPPDSYNLKIPLHKTNVLLAKLDTIPAYKPPPPKKYRPNYHRVKSGESLSTIARRYKVRISDLKAVNRIKSDTILAGKRLKIPGRKYASRSYSSNSYKDSPKNRVSVHTVQKGDSLWNLARRYGTTTNIIKKYNKLRSNGLKIGQKLKFPNSYKKRSNRKQVYLVKRGDSPFQIASKHNMDLAEFLRINRLRPGSKIYPGQELFVE